MSSVAHLFVYGTLLSTYRKNPFARHLAEHAQLIGRARVPGRLYALKRYPGLRPPHAEGDWVEGEVYRLRVPVRTLRVLDVYEGPDYRRVRTWVQLEERERASEPGCMSFGGPSPGGGG